ncbi:hypothetical protein TNCV_673301 [Trichonephila clavipes]|uniref:Uncharacterized protein n=1 Tax=Trichonephila clavipes TaxID=2585209 RepID=A0A8X6WD45_TRICX|nr:hypothetical protein TNCV_673301 [Trichonephila clavipes]
MASDSEQALLLRMDGERVTEARRRKPKKGRRLKIQRGFAQGVLELEEHLDLDFLPEPLVSSMNPTIVKVFEFALRLPRQFPKKKKKKEAKYLNFKITCPRNDRHHIPIPDWMHIYADGSLLKD